MQLSDDQKVIYLSNIIGIVRVDGKIDQNELVAIERIQKHINARKIDLNKAYSIAESDDFEPKIIGSWADQVKNLEHMIYTSLVDREINENEKKYILSFASKIKVNQEQLSIIFSDAKSSIQNNNNNYTCKNCNAQISESVKFCPECGISINEQVYSKSINISYEIPSEGVAIEFAESTAAGFAFAVKSMKNAQISKECTKGKKQWYLAAWSKNQILDALDLVDNLKGMRNRKVYVDGEELQWNDVFGFANCVNNRKSAYRPIEYCFGLDDKNFNIWGCKNARMDWNEWANWFSYGTFKKSGSLSKNVSFQFNKDRIRHELESNLYSYMLCPYIQFDLIEAILNIFPNEVVPGNNGKWKFKRDYSESPGSIFIKEKVKEDGYVYTNEYHSTGVVPASMISGIEILKNALSNCKKSQDIIKSILDHKD